MHFDINHGETTMEVICYYYVLLESDVRRYPDGLIGYSQGARWMRDNVVR
jgi:hypothetical protein